MKTFVALIVSIGLFALAFAALPVKVNVCRLAGSSTPSGGFAYFNKVDSTDSFEVDTLFSDTVNVDTTVRAVIQYYLDTIIRGTGCNDSLLLIINTFTKTNSGSLSRLLFSDTLGGNTIVKDTNFRHFASDTLLYDKVYFRIILKDSAIVTTNSAAGGKKLDTNYLRGNIEVIQRLIQP
jgi:hypothetical protein